MNISVMNEPATTDGYLLLGAIAVPLVCSILLSATGRKAKGLVRPLALAGFLIPTVIAFMLWNTFSAEASGSGYLFMTQADLGLSSLGINLKLGLNGISMPLFLLASIVGLAAGVYAMRGDDENKHWYLVLLLIMQTGLLGVFASIDIFFFYFFHEFALIPTFIMIGLWGGRERRYAAMEMTIYLTLGAMLSLLGLIAVYTKSGLNSFDMISLKAHLAAMPLGDVVQQNIFALLLIGFGILVSLFPFHSWAPRGYAAAPASAAMLHAGVLKKFGLYGLVQIALPLLPAGAAHFSNMLLWLAAGNVVLIGLVTMTQTDLKRMLGYSSVMHMGYAFMGIAGFSIIGVSGAVLLMFAHGVSVALLFLLADCICRRTQTCEMPEMGGLFKKTPILCGFFVAASLASIGLPGFANFWGEFTIFVGLWQFSPAFAVVAITGIVISAIYGLRAVARIFYGPASAVVQDNTIEDLAICERTPAVILFVALIAVGVFPKLISDDINMAISDVYKAPVTTVAEPVVPATTQDISNHES